jgi:hypothetical protein
MVSRSFVSSTLLGVALVGSMAQAPKDGATLDADQLKKQTTAVMCTANQSVKVDGLLLQVDRAAILASGNCKVQVTNSRVVSRTAVSASGNAEITFDNSIVDGALSLNGNAVASFKSSTVNGKVRKLQSAAVKDLGHNVWH